MQFFIEAVDSRLHNIIDSLLINLDTLQLGADFTEEMTFTGYHNISHITMSFRVTCQNGYCGKDCIAMRTNNARLLSCLPDGNVVCTNSVYNPLANCNKCYHNLDISTDCSTCMKPSFDPDTNCIACLPGYDIGSGCSTCLNTNYDLSANCTTCLLEGRDPLTSCTQCLPNRDTSTNCTTCLFGYIGENCTQGELFTIVFRYRLC